MKIPDLGLDLITYLLAAGCWLLTAGCWLLAAGCWPLAGWLAGCWLAGCLPAGWLAPWKALRRLAANSDPRTSDQQATRVYYLGTCTY